MFWYGWTGGATLRRKRLKTPFVTTKERTIVTRMKPWQSCQYKYHSASSSTLTIAFQLMGSMKELKISAKV